MGKKQTKNSRKVGYSRGISGREGGWGGVGGGGESRLKTAGSVFQAGGGRSATCEVFGAHYLTVVRVVVVVHRLVL